MQLLFAVILVANYIGFAIAARLAGECAMMCNDLRTEVLTLAMCRDAKRTLPRPKVGDFCSTAMEQGFSDACVALCMDETPKHRVAQTCRAAAIEMPRPTVRKWCEHGYNVAFTKTVADLKNRWKSEAAEPILERVSEPEVHIQQVPVVAEDVSAESHREHQEVRRDAHRHVESENTDTASASSGLRGVPRQSEEDLGSRGSRGTVVATIPITLDDATHDLHVHEGQNAEDAVAIFCREHVPDDVSTCIRQLLSVVIDKLDELHSSV